MEFALNVTKGFSLTERTETNASRFRNYVNPLISILETALTAILDTVFRMVNVLTTGSFVKKIQIVRGLTS